MVKDKISFEDTSTGRRFGISKIPRRKSYCLYEEVKDGEGVCVINPLAWIKERESAERVVSWLNRLTEGGFDTGGGG
jgi:hypothetical protein